MDTDLKPSDKDASDGVEDGTHESGDDNPPLEDDVPPNFFDDFMDEDFIDGLNVVDTWDEDEPKKTTKTQEKQRQKHNSAKRSSPLRRRRLCRHALRRRSSLDKKRISPDRKYTTSPDRKHSSPDRKRSSPDRKRSSPDRKHSSPDRKRSSPDRKRSSSDRKRSNSRDKERERRDPNKTQRDILRDKDKCAKDQKAKIISEKLRVVETGLVPPGMEMEVDILPIPSSQIESKLQKIRKSIERTRSPGLSRKHRQSSLERIQRSPIRKNRLSPPRRVRSRTRSRSARRKIERRLEERRIQERRSLERRVEERRGKRRRSSSRSPRKHRSKSPNSDVSERERWLRRRSRSRSPRRNKGFLQEFGVKFTKPSDKKSFLKELKETMHKPTEAMPQPIAIGRPSHPNFMPAPVPPPQNFIPQTLIIPAQQDYDQQFFIGQPDLVGHPNFPQPMPHPINFIPQDLGPHMCHTSLQPMHVSYMMDAPIPQPVPMPDYIPLTPHPQTPKPSTPLMGKEALSKLFNDKKITLSDYLSMTGKFTDESRPVNIQNKIKVISDCQDVIKELSAETWTSGRFIVRKTKMKTSEKEGPEGRSPFKKIPLVRFQFTSRSKPSEEKPTMASLLSKLLSRYGKESIFEEVIPKTSPVESTSTQSPPPPPVIYVEEKKAYTSRTKTIFCQTDRFKCADCESRYSKVSLHMTTQTSDILTFDVGCQVGPDDFPKSPAKGILKNQSLAYLTPAQLLANARGESPPPMGTKYSFDSSLESKRPNRGAGFSNPYNDNDDDSYQGQFKRNHDFDDFERYRSESERPKGPLMYERDRGVGFVGNRERPAENRSVGRPEDFGNTVRLSGQFGYQPKNIPSQWPGVDPPFHARAEDENPQFRGPGGPPFNQPGQIAYRGPSPRLNVSPPEGMFGRRF